MDASDMETTGGGVDSGDAGRHHIEVVQTDKTLVRHVDGQPVGGEELSAEDGVRDVCHVKLLSEGMPLAEKKG